MTPLPISLKPVLASSAASVNSPLNSLPMASPTLPRPFNICFRGETIAVKRARPNSFITLHAPNTATRNPSNFCHAAVTAAMTPTMAAITQVSGQARNDALSRACAAAHPSVKVVETTVRPFLMPCHTISALAMAVLAAHTAPRATRAAVNPITSGCPSCK